MLDNGFWVVFFIAQIAYETLNLLQEKNQSNNEVNTIVLMFHCVVVIIHSFIFICIKSAYDEIKFRYLKQYCTNVKKENDSDYLNTLERRQCNSNEGYEIPTVRESNIYEPSDLMNAYEPVNEPRAVNQLVYAEIYSEPRLVQVYDELPADRSNDEYSTLQIIR